MGHGDDIHARNRRPALGAVGSCLFGAMLLGCGAAQGSDPGQGVVEIEPETVYQTMVGFGAFGGQRPEYAGGPLFTPRFLELGVEDLGLSMLRMELPTSLEPANENDDPNVLDLGAFNLLGGHRPGQPEPLGYRIPYLRAMREAGVSTFFASAWSPPAWMKHNGALNNGDKNEAPAYQRHPGPDANQLRVDAYEEFAELWVAYIRLLEQEAGIVLDAVSLQNEPRFSQFYRSAVYDGEALRQLVKIVGARFEEEGIKTGIILPEDVGNFEKIRGLAEPTLQDPEARKYVTALAVHGYLFDGVRPALTTPQVWEEMRDLAAAYDLPLWVTETSGFDPDWDGAMKLALSIDTALRHGNAAAWLYFRLGERPGQTRDALILGGENPTRRYDVARHFYREIRPGAVRIETRSGEPDIRALAFRGPGRESGSSVVTVTLVNPDDRSHPVRLAGRTLPEHWSGFRSSEGERAVPIEDLAAGDMIPLPPRSIVTLSGAPASGPTAR